MDNIDFNQSSYLTILENTKRIKVRVPVQDGDLDPSVKKREVDTVTYKYFWHFDRL